MYQTGEPRRPWGCGLQSPITGWGPAMPIVHTHPQVHQSRCPRLQAAGAVGVARHDSSDTRGSGRSHPQVVYAPTALMGQPLQVDTTVSSAGFMKTRDGGRGHGAGGEGAKHQASACHAPCGCRWHPRWSGPAVVCSCWSALVAPCCHQWQGLILVHTADDGVGERGRGQGGRKVVVSHDGTGAAHTRTVGRAV